MKIQAVRLTRQGNQLVVDVQTQNGWIEAIRESDDGTTPISHICEQSGLVQANRDACDKSSMNDLVASGGIQPNVCPARSFFVSLFYTFERV